MIERQACPMCGCPNYVIEDTVLEELSEEAIAGAVARGWCHPDNERKVMDEKLAWAIVAEIRALLSPDEPREEAGDADARTGG